MNTFLLTVDSGNTAIKWGLYDGRQWLAQGATSQGERMALAQAWAGLPSPASVIVSNVASSQVAEDLIMLLAPWRVQPMWVTAQACQCGVRNRYANPGQLGCDRWAALIAAWHRLQRACLVVDVGTAMTVDALSTTGEFLGGIIIPGLDTMKKALTGWADFSPPASGHFQGFPSNTGNGLYSGIIQALAGALERMHDLLAGYPGIRTPVPVIMSGGGVALLDSHIRIPHRIIDHLVLEGLVVIAGTMKPRAV